jgi:Acyl-CoA dehydrogenase, C-terminal domain
VYACMCMCMRVYACVCVCMCVCVAESHFFCSQRFLRLATLDAPHGHCEVHFEDVRVPCENMILGEGRGFEIAQARLGPGRIHHCMRLIGVAERCLEAMCERVLTRKVFGGRLARQGTIVADIAQSRVGMHPECVLGVRVATVVLSMGAWC